MGFWINVSECRARPARYDELHANRSGKVRNGRVVVDAELPEGADVMLLALDGEETFEVGAELEAVFLQSMAQGRRGEIISGDDLLAAMRDVSNSADLQLRSS